MSSTGFYSPELRVQVLTLWAIQMQPEQISSALDIPADTVRAIIQKGKERGYNPQ